MNKEATIRFVEQEMMTQKQFPVFSAGDTITVKYKIIEGNKERIQNYQGVVIKLSGKGAYKTFTVRKMSNNVGVERIFPFMTPFIEDIEVNKRGKVRRARIYYFRKLKGKKARIKERIV
jgi:large subunit ribosomal protein L19